MAKKFIRISLATKLRLLFGSALIGIIVAALLLPWYFMELLVQQGVKLPGEELARLGYRAFIQEHPQRRTPARQALDALAAQHAAGASESREGPRLIVLAAATSRPAEKPPAPGRSEAEPSGLAGPQRRKAADFFNRNPEENFRFVPSEDARGRTVYRCFRAVRAEPVCLTCHGTGEKDNPLLHAGQLAAMVEVVLPGDTASGPLVWWTRVAFIAGGALAAIVAFIAFAFLSQRLILRPVRQLRDLSDRVAEGDLSVRSQVKTGDELQRLGDGFNEMLTAIEDQHGKLRSANRALDLKLTELAEANVTLYKANQVKNEFLANVSHELRTPLNSIIGFAELLGESADDRVARYGQNIASSARSLLNMINGILDLARIEAGKADVRFDKVSVTDTCQTLAALMQPLADKKQLTLKTELAEDIPLVVTDAGKLQQILYNLLSNAVKFTPPGGQVTLSTVRSSVRREEESYEEVAICVSDTGPGIAESEQDRIFEKFYRLDPSLTRESSGTGLGLAISRELTNLIGGRLALKSSPGHGSSFTLTLPVEPRKTDTMAKA